MLKTLLLVGLATILAGCHQPVDRERAKEELLETDRAFSRMSVEKGSVLAFHEYIAEDGFVLPKFGSPSQKEDYARLTKELQNIDLKSTLSWVPIRAEISKGADLGFTHGKYHLEYHDSLGNKKDSYGYYITVWRKQHDGFWKFIADAGNESDINIMNDSE